MVALALSWMAIGGFGTILGAAALGFVDTRPLMRPADRLVVAAWLGSVFLGSAMLAVSIVTPLRPLIAVVVAVGLAVMALLRRRTRELLQGIRHLIHPCAAVGFAALLIGVALFTSQRVTLYDTGLYHAGLIQWLGEAGSVRGLALLHVRFGFSSSWFALAAPLNASTLSGHVTALTGGFAVLLAALQFVIAIARIATGRAQRCDWFIAGAYLLVLTWMIRIGISVSPSPDVPVILLVVLTGWTMVAIAAYAAAPGSAGGLLPARSITVLVAASAVSIKPSAFPLLVVAAGFCIGQLKTGRQLAMVSILSGAFILPAVAANLVTSGCPLYPSPVLCAPLPWSDSKTAKALTDVIGSFQRWAGNPPPNANWWNWIPQWIAREAVGSILIVYAIVAAAALLVVRRKVTAGPVGWLLLLSFSGLLYVLAFSPGTRFFLGYAVIPPAYLAAVVSDSWKLPAVTVIPPIIAAVVSIRAFTNVYMETALFTPSAMRFCLIGLISAASIAVALFARSALLRVPRPQLTSAIAFAASGCLVATLFFTANFELMPPSASLVYSIRHADYGPVLLTPPPIPSIPASQLIRQTTNDVSYVLPPSGTYQCWAAMPCAPFPLPSDVRLLDPTHGIDGGLRRR